MLSRFENKRIRAAAEDGSVFPGTAEVDPSGHEPVVFDRAEERIRSDDGQLFPSELRKIELISEDARPSVQPGPFDALIEELLEGPYQIVDLLPAQVPADAAGQYFAVERYYLQTERLRSLRRRQAEILLRLNCYFDMAVSFDSCESWEVNPDPEIFAEHMEDLSGGSFLRAVFEAQHAMIDLDPGDTYMTVFDPDSRLSDMLRELAAAAGLFLSNPPEEE